MGFARVRGRRLRPARAWLFPPPLRPMPDEGTVPYCAGDHQLTEQRRLADRPKIPRGAADEAQLVASLVATGTDLPAPAWHG
jgi:hypothetical protein